MKNTKLNQVFASMKTAKECMAKLTPKQKSLLEKGWNIEHAYYSSALAGSDLDRKEFDALAKKVS